MFLNRYESMNVDRSFSRRQFVKTFALGTVASGVLGSRWTGSLLADVQLETTAATGNLVLHLSSFTALQSANGSIRLAVNSFIPTVPSSATPYYPVLINRGSGNQFFALKAQCTHQGCVVPTFGTPCPCHGSVYAINGTVISGPAPSALTQYPITFDGSNTLTVQLPNLGFSVTSSEVQGPPARLQLSFPTQTGLTYEVRFMQNVTQAATVVSFATTPAGTANQTSISGNDATRTVYVDQVNATGFFVVNIKVTQG